MDRETESDLIQAEPKSQGKLRTASSNPKDSLDFQAMITQGRTEKIMKASQKRLEDLSLIDKWHSKAEIVPFLEIFPKEVWAVILSHLEDPMDLWNMWNVHPMFRSLTEKSRTAEVLFPQIIGLLSSYHNHLNGHRTTCECSDCNQYPKLDYNCKLRRVSRSLRNAVDKSYEDRLVSNLHTDLDPIPSLVIRLPMDRFYLNRFLSDFCEGPEETRAKRCFHRSFELQILKHQVVEMSVEFFNEFSQDLLHLLQSFGDQIWHFKIKFFNSVWLADPMKFRDGEYWCFRIYELVCQCSSLMTSLKWIEFDVYDLHFLRHTMTLKSFFRNHPFPLIPNLEKIRFVPCKNDVFLGFEILAPVLQANLHVKSLSVKTCYEGDKMSKFYIRLFEFMQTIPFELEALDFERCNHETRHFANSLGFLQPLNNLDLPLKRLGLSGIDASAKGTLASSFHLLNNFPFLEELSLSFVELSVGGELPFLKLPQLTHFRMTILKDTIDYSRAFNVAFFYSLQFLLHSRKLKHLIYSNKNRTSWWKIQRFMRNHECHEKMLNFRGGRRDLTYSNIWDAFPALEYLKTENECEEKMLARKVLDLKRLQCVKYIREYRNGKLVSFKKDNSYLFYKMMEGGSDWYSFNPSWIDEE